MELALVGALFAGGLFVCMLLFIEVGRRIGTFKLAHEPDGLAKGVGAAEGAVFGLLGLIIAFTFSGAASRFEDRRMLVKEEANAIGTAYLRLDLLPTDAQPPLRELFRRYLDVRLATYRNVTDQTATKTRLAEGTALQEDLWAKALAACRRPDAAGHAAMLLLPALNAMFDITTTRVVATQNHPPWVIYLLLAGLSLVGSLLVGYGMAGNKNRTWLHTVAFAAIMALAVYVILDLEFPRLGLVRIDAADQVLIDIRKGMR
jgi:hypothetical protein